MVESDILFGRKNIGSAEAKITSSQHYETKHEQRDTKLYFKFYPFRFRKYFVTNSLTCDNLKNMDV